ncbi:MAG TPA: trehalase family glycosidase [Fimbriimonas sp.]|nr:trehalase family glycosidase [Fimbriimonas sp.]
MVCPLITLAMQTGSTLHIGNYLVSSPNALAFIVGDKAALVMDPGGEYFAGPAAPDDSYHKTQFKAGGATVTFEWGRVGETVVARLNADHPTAVTFKFPQNHWPGFSCPVTAAEHGATSIVAGKDWELRADGAPVVSAEGISFLLDGKTPSHFVAGFRRLPDLKGVDHTLYDTSTAYETHRVQASGDWGDFLRPVSDNLNNSRVYSSDDHRVAITVSRKWAPTVNDSPYFCWDSFFNGNLAALDDPKTAKETVRAILSWQTPEGLVPNFGHWKFDNGRASDDRSQPPVGSLCVWKIYQRWPDRAFLEEIYPKLLKWHRWWPIARDGKHDGLLEWGSSKAGKQGALWETGWDDTPHYEAAQMSGQTLNAYAVDLNSLWAMDAEYLAHIANAIGHKQDAKDLQAERDRTLKLINDKLWNPTLGIYCSRLWDGTFLTRLTPMNFYPMIAGAPDAAKAKSMLAILFDPKKFWGDFILPTLSRDDPDFAKQDYWKGKVWAPVNYLVFQGLLKYASTDQLNEFADKSVKLFMKNWTANGVCGENYLSTTGAQSSDAHYTWGALLCLIGLENACVQNPDGTVRVNGTLNVTMDLQNVVLNGRKFEVKVTPKKTQLIIDGYVVIEAANAIVNGSLSGT